MGGWGSYYLDFAISIAVGYGATLLRKGKSLSSPLDSSKHKFMSRYEDPIVEAP